jgi:RNA polymerase sigma-70 factor (ECF subfamily)
MDERDSIVPQPIIADLMARIRDGDEDAARDLLEHYRPHLIRIIRVRLTDPRLRREFDSCDVCQSVFGDFFLAARMGEFEINSPEELLKYLAKAANHRIIDRYRRASAQRRDVQRQEGAPVEELGVASNQAAPSRYVSGREILERALGMMNPGEREVARRRLDGDDWASIAAATGEKSDAVRVRFSRTLARVTSALEL